MSKKRFVIGDIHGHYDALIGLFSHISPSAEDEVYFLGDLIDRGPKSSDVVKFVMDNGYNCILGNHEFMMLDVLAREQINPEAFQGWLYNGGYSTVISYGNKIPSQHIHWIAQLPLYIDLEDYWLVHAGVDPYMPIEKQNAEQFCWIRETFHRIKTPIFENKTIITGHTITFTFTGVKPGNIAAGKGWLSIDTGVYHHSQGWLTALELNELKVHQVNSFGKNYRCLPLDEVMTNINQDQVFSRI